MKKHLKIIYWIAVSVILLFPLIQISQLTSGAPAPPTSSVPIVNIALEETNKTANVAPGNTCRVTFNGTVSVTCAPGIRVVVTLEALPIRCYATVSPPALDFTRNGEQPFTVTAIMNQKESSKTIGTVTVVGYWHVEPGSIQGTANPEDGITATVFVAPFYDFSIHSSGSYDEVSPDSELVFEITIINEGNDDDVYLIEVTNVDELSDLDFQVELSHSQIWIQENSASIVILSVKTPTGVSTAGSHKIFIEVYSQKGSEHNLEPESLTCEVIIPFERTIFTPGFFIIIVIIIAAIIGGIFYYRRRKKKKEARFE